MEIEIPTQIKLENSINQTEFLNSSLWKTINNGIDIGIRYLLPDLIEEEIIDLKNNLINYGLKDGMKKTIDSVIETGKQTMGIFSGNFENIGQIQRVIKNGGIIDKVSDVLDVVIDKAKEKGKIDYNISQTLRKGKTSILSSIERNIEYDLNNQISIAKHLDKYINNWNEFYSQRNFEGMQREYEKIRKEIKELVPLENTINNARYIQNMHNYIKNNGMKFDLNEEETSLLKKLN